MIVDRGLISIGVLAGGRSRRMGIDKAHLVLDGETMLERAVRNALATEQPVAVSGMDTPEAWTLPSIPFIPDLIPFAGPLHGITRLLEHFMSPLLVIGCDMPLVTPDALEWLIGQAGRRTGEEGLTVIDRSGTVQPLFSVYTPAVLARPDVDSGEGSTATFATTSSSTTTFSTSFSSSARVVIETGRFERIAIPEDLEAALWSVDTPADFELLRGGSASNPSSSSI